MSQSESVHLAKAIERMLNAEGIRPGVAVSYAPEAEAGNRNQPMAYVLPDALTAQRNARVGSIRKQRTVGVVVVQDCLNTETAKIEQLLADVDQIVALLGTRDLVDEEDNQLATASTSITVEQLYSTDRLAEGVFVSVIIAEYISV